MGTPNYEAAHFIERINSTVGLIDDNPIDEALATWHKKIARMGIMPESMSMGIMFSDSSFCIITKDGIFSLAPEDVLAYLVDEGEKAMNKYMEENGHEKVATNSSA